MNGEEIQAKLGILRENLDKLARIPQATIEEFQGDFRNVDAALHLLQTSIQALLDIGSYKPASDWSLHEAAVVCWSVWRRRVPFRKVRQSASVRSSGSGIAWFISTTGSMRRSSIAS